MYFLSSSLPCPPAFVYVAFGFSPKDGFIRGKGKEGPSNGSAFQWYQWFGERGDNISFYKNFTTKIILKMLLFSPTPPFLPPLLPSFGPLMTPVALPTPL